MPPIPSGVVFLGIAVLVFVVVLALFGKGKS
jgi:hypothetical protein